jgi:hypothetical protein
MGVAPAMPDRPHLTSLHVRCNPHAARLIRQAADAFYGDGPRPVTEPVALGWMLELLAADYLAGPRHPHPGAGMRRLVENREATR